MGAQAADEQIQKRQIIELAAYFTHCAMRPTHVQLSLRSAMSVAFKAKCFRAAGEFARRLIQLEPSERIIQQATQVQTVCDRQSRNAIDIDYDQFATFDICARTLTPIYKDGQCVVCSYCEASYMPQFKGEDCNVCQIAKVGV